MAEQKLETPGPDQYEVDSGTVYFIGSQCSECHAVFYPEHKVCARCGSRDGERLRIGPLGTLYTWSRVHQSTPEFQTPYVLTYVDFPQNVRVLVPLVEDVVPRIGMEVELVLAPGPRRTETGALMNLVHVAPVKGRTRHD